MTFTSAQLTVLHEIEQNRITVVRAVPGAGKTRVFVEAFHRELDRSERAQSRAGVAALSFTNVAHEEIARRLARAIDAPHFVGTLDSFLFRFVVRPFGSLVGLTAAGARLLPSPLDEVHRGPEVQYSSDVKKQTSIFLARCVGGTEAVPVIRVDGNAVDARFASKVMLAKQNHWRNAGRLTHSDVHYLAACILRGPHGPAVRNLLARRFAVLLVDEFQDTGYFLGRALTPLLEGSTIKGVVVGDPDQAIFRFGGAQHALFSVVEALAFRPASVLDESYRCSKSVAKVASALSRSGNAVRSLVDAPEGSCLLLVYERPPDMRNIILTLGNRVTEPVAILARSNATVRKVGAGTSTSVVPAGSRIGRAMSKAVERLTDGDSTIAARITASVLADLVFGDANIDAEGLRAHSISAMAWRKACHAVLFEAMYVKDGETWNQWLGRVRDRVRLQAKALGRPIAKIGTKIRSFEANDEVRNAGRRVPADIKNGCVMTVHQAKGREFSSVFFYVPKPHKRHAPCPSSEWWSSAADSEEREIAFVACSRAIHTLVLVVHKQTFEALKSTQPAFVSLFNVQNIQHELS